MIKVEFATFIPRLKLVLTLGKDGEQVSYNNVFDKAIFEDKKKYLLRLLSKYVDNLYAVFFVDSSTIRQKRDALSVLGYRIYFPSELELEALVKDEKR
jgi:hypothetical protein